MDRPEGALAEEKLMSGETPTELRQLALLRSELNEQFSARHAPVAQALKHAFRSRISSNQRT